MTAPGLLRTAIAVAVLGTAGGAAAATAQDTLLVELKRLAERVEKLERRNAELEARLTKPADRAALASRVAALEQQNSELAASLESDRISDREPELVTRLKAVETLAEATRSRTAPFDALDGIAIESSVLAVAQRVNAGARDNDNAESQLTWRGDIAVSLPGGDVGRASGQFFAHVRLGQGESFTRLNPTFTGALNSTAFQLGNPDGERNAANSTALLAQAWYQLDVPLPLGGHAEASTRHLELTVGKIDPFVFFDQNAIADDEGERFLNNVFVHNPLLDSGGAVGADDYGFSPGARVAFRSDAATPDCHRTGCARPLCLLSVAPPFSAPPGRSARRGFCRFRAAGAFHDQPEFAGCLAVCRRARPAGHGACRSADLRARRRRRPLHPRHAGSTGQHPLPPAGDQPQRGPRGVRDQQPVQGAGGSPRRHPHHRLSAIEAG